MALAFIGPWEDQDVVLLPYYINKHYYTYFFLDKTTTLYQITLFDKAIIQRDNGQHDTNIS